ncbi:hypothetical protein SDC9_185379 [bioreactor metagenome]|uniref:Uncharacterized protein n=1 Tax=bioreactor metagenome TaxID=1076179 RepID=A0A645HFQ6_9ZZZZ
MSNFFIKTKDGKSNVIKGTQMVLDDGVFYIYSAEELIGFYRESEIVIICKT